MGDGEIKSQLGHYLSEAISDAAKMKRLIIILSFFMASCIFIIILIFFALLIIKPGDLGISEIRLSNTSIYFNSGNELLEILQLPANQFWVESNVCLDDKSEINIHCSGLVSTRHDNYKDPLLNDTTIKYREFINEFQRYYVAHWHDPLGVPIMQIIQDTSDIDICERIINSKSKNLNFLSGDNYEYGAVVGFIISKNEQRILETYSVNEKIKYIDSLIVYGDNSKIKKFYIGNSASIYSQGNCFVIPQNKPTIDIKIRKEEFLGSKIYFSINDAVIRDTNDIMFSELYNHCECNDLIKKRKLHAEFFEKYSRKHALWYLDNSGSFNIFILAK